MLSVSSHKDKVYHDAILVEDDIIYSIKVLVEPVVFL